MVPGMRVLFLFLLLGGCALDPAGSCALVRVAELPVQLVGNVPVLTVGINGRPAAMILDTGASVTILDAAAAARTGVRVAPQVVSGQGAGGRVLFLPGRIDRLDLGGATLDRTAALVRPGVLPPFDGLLGLNVLVNYELDLDAPHNRLTLYKARPCATAAPDWTGPVTQLPTQQNRSGQLFVTVMLDGATLRGTLDTGASRTSLALHAARDAGITPEALQAAPGGRTRAINPGGFAVKLAQFKALQVGADTLAAPVLLIGDLPPSAGDLLVGGDYLMTRRVWIAVGAGRVFVQPSLP